ncbi:response regulator [Pseudomaricurvus alkylphenolicus]|uniref:ATP-binding protein n=1 Tax=Pseudomaricurvus alkylphenolicus TaxID=1306991 RepID=UPI0014209E61|nr:ATP-binding protein [Pseudomaricurvus alkylphenolicus]NIB42843.1 response regulator [Pseudomaricurvus alkylphenolicus]
MRATQSIFRVRRQYNKWVGNETLEDYALRFTATRARRWPLGRIGMTALGATAFMALEALSAAATLQYGFINTLWAMLAVAAVIFITGFPISYYSAKHGLDIDLLTRGGGFGYLGSTITSLIYASFTFIFFAIEAAIFASALKALFQIPLWAGYIISALIVVPIVTHGIAAISRFQVGSQPFWLLLQCCALIAVVYYEFDRIDHWHQFVPREHAGVQGFNLALFGASASIFFAMVAQIGEQVDYLRFFPQKTEKNKKRWWFWLIMAGPGWIWVGLIKMLLGSFLAYLAFTKAMPYEKAIDPVYMYQMAFDYIFSGIANMPSLSLILAGVMVIISQMKINVTNAYAGSIAWSNFFSRLTHSHPGRVVWLVFNVTIALVLMELGVYRVLEAILGIFAIVAISWLASLSADLLINKPLGLSPPMVEFKRAYLYDINPVGVGSMVLASILGFVCYLGYLGESASQLAHFISLLACFICVPLIAWLTRGRFYLARPRGDIKVYEAVDIPSHSGQSTKGLRCCICESEFELDDMSHCPAYQGPICSLCCSLDARCLDNCKPDARLKTQLNNWLDRIAPALVVKAVHSRIVRFATTLTCVSLLNGGFLALIYFHLKPESAAETQLLSTTIWMLFFSLSIISGVISWLFLLAHESRVVAQQESNRQTQLLIDEIEAHQETDRALQLAKEQAENANSAKTRYLSGISHELRTPLQSILGYAQLLSNQKDIPDQHQRALGIISNSGEHLADLIEGLLDISKIEAGRLDIYRNRVRLPELLDQLVKMFEQQARNKGIEFNFQLHHRLPKLVIADEKRLRQILINLLSNAIKYTDKGRVDFHVYYRNQVAEFSVVDTGIGIAQNDIERIFTPFERVRNSNSPHTPGTGLGLTIVRLLTEIMGGNLDIKSTPGAGSCFSVSLMLSWVDDSQEPSLLPKVTTGYLGLRRTLMIVDDEPLHRGLMSDILMPLGFNVIEAQSAENCLQTLEEVTPDLFILDVNMPGMNGHELARTLREQGIKAPILMLSAEANEQHPNALERTPHDDYMVKPIRNPVLLEKIGKLLHLDWQYQSGDAQVISAPCGGAAAQETEVDIVPALPEHPLLQTLLTRVQIGHRKGVLDLLDDIRARQLLDDSTFNHLHKLAMGLQFEQMELLLEGNPA